MDFLVQRKLESNDGPVYNLKKDGKVRVTGGLLAYKSHKQSIKAAKKFKTFV
jgi:hypothetical protein